VRRHGARQAFGPISLEKNEPVSHAPWEARISAIWSAMNGPQIENYFGSQTKRSTPAPEEPPLGYFEWRYAQTIELLVATGMITRAEFESGRPAEGTWKGAPLLTADIVASWFSNDDNPWKCDVEVTPQFRVGQLVYARNMNPDAQRRRSCYARGKVGVIERDHGVFAFPHSTVQCLDAESQHLYSVRFTACELWGQAHPKDTVVVNMWGDELEAM
jgi:hypothetical protein